MGGIIHPYIPVLLRPPRPSTSMHRLESFLNLWLRIQAFLSGFGKGRLTSPFVSGCESHVLPIVLAWDCLCCRCSIKSWLSSGSLLAL